MPIGDDDFGVFFNPNDFAVPVAFGGSLAYGILDSPGQDARFGDAAVSDTSYRLEIAATAFTPMPNAGKAPSKLTVNGVSYVVTSVNPLDDGSTVELKLRKS